MIDVIVDWGGAFLITVAANVVLFGIVALLLTQAEGDRPARAHLLVLILGMSALGTCAGFSGGLSREPAVGAIIPALFGLLGGVVVYLFGVDRTRGAVASLMAACLSVSLFGAFVVSSQFRNSGDELRDLRDHCMTAYTNADLMGDPAALEAFEARFLPYCTSALDWNLDDYHRAKVAAQLKAH